MRKKLSRISALSLAAALMFSQAAYADNVVTATSPGASTSETTSVSTSNTGSTSTSTAISSTATVATGGVISQSGPSSSKTYDANGNLVIGAESSNYSGQSSTYGPGGTTAAGQTTTQTTTSQTTTSGTTAAQPGTTTQTTTQTTTSQTAAATTQTTTQTAAQTQSNVSAVVIDSSVTKPSVSAGAAVLYDATTRQILFEKNGGKAMFPASTTKLLTALVVAEKADMSDSFTFSGTAVNNLESGAVTAGMKEGDQMTVKDAMYALLLRSACEVANGLAEKVGGSQSSFAELMNQRAKELGCTGSNFRNASGLNDSNHYTTAADMALITAAALANPTVRTILSTTSYKLPATSHRSELSIKTGNKMVSGGSESYSGYIGGKTGYTSKAGNCLAGAIDYNGHELVAVVLKANGSHYTDTRAMFDYGKKLIGASTAAGTTGTTAANASQTTGTTAATAAGTASAASTSDAKGKWVDNKNGTWKYQKADGTYCVSEWLTVNGNTYFFGSDALMCTGWKQFTNQDWYYFNPENGAMVRGKWVTQNGKSYYLQANGVMAVNTVIDGKYKVNENGVFVEKVG